MFLAFLLQLLILIQQQMPAGPSDDPEPTLTPAVVGYCDELGTVRSDDVVRFRLEIETIRNAWNDATAEIERMESCRWNIAGREGVFEMLLRHQRLRVLAWENLYWAQYRMDLPWYACQRMTELRDIIGPANYYAGEMPAPMIVWDCSEK